MELVEAIAGLRPGTPDNLPLIGPGALDGLFLACGHYRNGILLAPTTGEALASLLTAAPPVSSPFRTHMRAKGQSQREVVQ
jgi:glycine oxidase